MFDTNSVGVIKNAGWPVNTSATSMTGSSVLSGSPYKLGSNDLRLGEGNQGGIGQMSADLRYSGVDAYDTGIDGLSVYRLGDTIRRLGIGAIGDRTQIELPLAQWESYGAQPSVETPSTAVTVRLAAKKILAPTFKILEHWVGRVDAISSEDQTFEAIVSSTTRECGDETAEFTFDELSDDDKELVAIGAVFYWSVGYQVEPSAQRSTVSNIRFRRLPVWTRKELEAAENKAKELSQWLTRGGTGASGRASQG